jgi:hypothetical protein
MFQRHLTLIWTADTGMPESQKPKTGVSMGIFSELCDPLIMALGLSSKNYFNAALDACSREGKKTLT